VRVEQTLYHPVIYTKYCKDRLMNIPVLIVAVVTLLAFLAHLFGGTRETAAIAPAEGEDKLAAHWVQAMCAFQMLAVDLLVVAVALFAIVFTDLGPHESLIIQGFALLFFLWGTVWVIQVVWLKHEAVGLLRLPHWIVWFVCALLLLYGS